MKKLLIISLLFLSSNCFACRFLILLVDKSSTTEAGTIMSVREDNASLGRLENEKAEIPIGIIDVPGMTKDEGQKYMDTYEVIIDTKTTIPKRKYFIDYKTYIVDGESKLNNTGKISINKDDVTSVIIDKSVNKLVKDAELAVEP